MSSLSLEPVQGKAMFKPTHGLQKASQGLALVWDTVCTRRPHTPVRGGKTGETTDRSGQLDFWWQVTKQRILPEPLHLSVTLTKQATG